MTKLATEVATVDVVIQWFHRRLQRQAEEVVTEEVTCSDIRRARGHTHSCATPLPTLSNTSEACSRMYHGVLNVGRRLNPPEETQAVVTHCMG